VIDITLMGPRTLTTAEIVLADDYRARLISEIKNSVGENNYATNVKAKMTSWHIYNDTNIFNDFLDGLSQICRGLSWVYTENKHFKMESMWGAVYNKGDYTIRHDHKNNLISFVYFLTTGNSNTPLIFEELNYKFTPQVNSIIFFPGDIVHYVPPHQGDEERIVLAGNVCEAYV